MASLRPPPPSSSSLSYLPPTPPPVPETAMAKPPLLDLEVTIVSAKHLKNVNWLNGDLKPYAVAYLHPDRRAATKTDDAGSTRPVWNERLTLPLPSDDDDLLILTIDVFHSKPSETPKPLVGTVRFPLKDLLHPGGALTGDTAPIRTLELRRPSGRPHGKIRIKIAVRERLPSLPESIYHHQFQPPSGYYYSNVPPPARDYRTFSPPPQPHPSYNHHHANPPPPSHYAYGSYSDPYSSGGYYSSTIGGYYPAAPPPAAPPAAPPARSYYDRVSGYVASPSAPTDYSSGPASSYDLRAKGGRMGMGTGLAVGALAGTMGGLGLEEGLKHNEHKVNERVESDFTARDDYSDYRADY